jgi:hypothetical protein
MFLLLFYLIFIYPIIDLILSSYIINIEYARLTYYIYSTAAFLPFAVSRPPPSPPPPHSYPLAAPSPPPPHSLFFPLPVPGPGRAAGAAPGSKASSPSNSFSPPARGDIRRWVAGEKCAEYILTIDRIRRDR